MIEAFIFDIDGTLIDSNDAHAEAWQKAFEKFDRKIPYFELRREVGKGGEQFLSVFLTQKEIKEFGKEAEKLRGEIFKKEYLAGIEPFPKVRELFLKIKKDGKKITLASSANKDELKEYKKIARIEDLTDDETSLDDAKEAKPEPDIFLAAVEKLGKIAKKNILVVGDTPFDAIAARKAGLQIIGVLSGGWTEKELLKAGCKKVYRDAADIYKNYKEI